MWQETKTCSRCGQPARPIAQYCGACGAALAATSSAITLANSGIFARGTLPGSGGRYRVEHTLGSGGFGEAYLAYDAQLDRYCVVKRLFVDRSRKPQDQQRIRDNFQREARLLVTLNSPGHPNIPEIYEYLAEHDCLVMKYIEGQNLGQILARRANPLPPETALRYVRDVCSALVYMHSRAPEPVLHRDIKPTNILLDATGRVWLIDFGLSKAAVVPALSAGGQITRGSGTPGFTPPEQWRGASQPRSDVFALAATLHVLLTNVPPDPTLLREVIHGRGAGLPPVRQLTPEVSPEIERLIQRATAVDVTARPTAQEFLAELDAILTQAAVPPPPALAGPPEAAEFVGRTDELMTLVEHLATHSLTVITGPAGVGKTALAATLARQAGDGTGIFWHTFHKDEGVTALIWELAAFLAQHSQGDLWRLLHGTPKTGSQPQPPEVLCDYLIQLIRGHGYLLCFDDLQFVEDDPHVRQLLGQLLDLARADEAMLIVTSRHVPGFVPVGGFAALAGLSAGDVRSLLANRGLALPDDLLDTLVRSTEGNAQLLMLAMDALQRSTDPLSLIAHLAQAPDIVRYLMAEVHTGLTEGERAVMGAVAALLGYSGTRDAIEAMLDRGALWEILYGLSSRYLLIVRETEADSEYVQHALVQAFYYEHLGKRARQVLHRRAGAYYETEEPDALTAARHYARAGEYARAATLATADIWVIVNRGQARALSHLLAEFTGQQLDAEQWIAVCIARGEIGALLGERDVSQESYRAALARLEPLPDSPAVRERTARVCRGMGELLEYEAPHDALAWLRRGLDELAGGDVDEEARVYHRIGSVLIATGAFDAARDALERSLCLLPPEPGELRADVLLNLGVIHCSQGRLESGRTCFLQALEIYERIHNYWDMATIWQNLGRVKGISGDWDGAAVEYRKALDMAERLGNVLRQAALEYCLGILQINQGRTEAAMTSLLTCLNLSRDHNLREYVISAQSSIADLQIRLGDWDAAEGPLSEAEHLALELNAEDQMPEIYRSRALLNLARGAREAALEEARRAMNISRALEDPLAEGMSLRVLGQVLHAAGHPTEELAVFAQSLALLDDQDPYEAARTRAQWGRALISSGAQEQGAALLKTARATFDQMGARHDLAAVQTLLEDTGRLS